MLRILIADDFPLFRRGVKELLTDGLESVTVGECGNSHDLLELVRRNKWDVVILDITMPGSNGTETLKQLKAEYPKLPVLVLSMHPEDQYAVRMFKAGADGYLTKASAPDELVEAIKKVLGGGQYVSSTLGEKLALTFKASTGSVPHEHLSDREYEVMCLIASGKTVSEIAETMHLGVTTISTYRARILEKMNLKNNAELTRYALKRGLVS
ncbi:MAG: response regulator transcription factor [Nitrospirae bacterium]|nr:response regulator transcription factor [Nitrospirota bacterium]MDE3039548.1 response regulator transcription factor [Nitrospirota bacterium]MDE3049479.1 response regulator transcription factor [Nitrospirota bacterium]